MLRKQLKAVGDLQQKIDSIGDTMSGKEVFRARSGIEVNIPRPTLSVYERVRQGKGGTAVVVW